jgi:hypothetical protein
LSDALALRAFLPEMRETWSFERIAGTALREMGYESGRGWWRRCRLRSRF